MTEWFSQATRSAPALILAAFSLIGAGCAPTGQPKSAAAYIREGNRHSSSPWFSSDPVGAAAEYRKAAELGSPEGCYLVGRCYDSGVGVPKSEDAATDWFRKGAEGGNIEAAYRLGLAYELGHGVAKSDILAYVWLNIAASSGHEKAMSRRDSLGLRMKEADVRKAQALSLARNPQS